MEPEAAYRLFVKTWHIFEKERITSDSL